MAARAAGHSNIEGRHSVHRDERKRSFETPALLPLGGRRRSILRLPSASEKCGNAVGRRYWACTALRCALAGSGLWSPIDARRHDVMITAPLISLAYSRR